MNEVNHLRHSLNPKRQGLWHGGDYNPEQWPETLWPEDMRLMDKAEFRVATIGVFSWASYEPREGAFQFDWMDRVMDMLAESGCHAVLATPSAAMPAWLSKKHPEILRAGRDGRRFRHGNRVNFCLSSQEYRSRTKDMARRLAERYGNHSALLLWHVSNEYGGECCCEVCAEAFRNWLRVKFKDDLDDLNRRWWTRFWSHSYSDWSEIEIPGAPIGEEAVLAMTLDWKRFVSDQTISFMKNEMGPLREITPHVPVTTNMMGFYPVIDYPKMARELDLVSWDSYPNFDGMPLSSESWKRAAMVHDAYRAMKPGKPFLLIESTPSTSNWYPYMRAKPPGIHRFEALQAIAHGSDGVMYFQWRQSKGSAEMYHGAVVTHAGAEGVRVFEEVAQVGQELKALEAVAGSTSKAEAAVIYDWETNWAHETVKMPLLSGFPYVAHCQAWHSAFWELGIAVDVVDQTADLSQYKLIVLPASIKLRSGFAAKLEEHVMEGGCLVATCLTGYQDDDLLAFEGGAPGPLRTLLGLSVHEVDALHPSETAAVGWNGQSFKVNSVCELAVLESAVPIGAFYDRFYSGNPAVTENRFGQGIACWVGADLGSDFTQLFVGDLAERFKLKRSIEGELPAGVTALQRTAEGREFLFVMNSNSHEAEVKVPRCSRLLDGAKVEGQIMLNANDVQVFVLAGAEMAVKG